MKAGKTPAHIGPDRLKQLEVKPGVYNFTPVVLENIEKLGLDYLVPIGGDDTLSFSQVLADKGVKLIAVPKTMDNDVQGTEYCIGFSTAISRAKDAINRQRTTPGFARADRHIPHLWPRRGLHCPLHGVCHQRSLSDPRI